MIANTDANGRFHSDWLSMMYSRLKLARNLLRDDGVIFISIDDNEVHNLRKICDEIFGAGNFVGMISFKRKKEVANDKKNISVQVEYLLVYSKTSSTKLKNEKLSENYLSQSYKDPNENFSQGRWRGVPITVSKGLSGGGYEYTIETPSGKKHKKIWAYPEESYKKLLENNRIYFGVNSDSIPQRVVYVFESIGQPVSNLWEHVTTNKEGKNTFLELLEDNIFDTCKPIKLIEKCMELSIDKNDLILDFFAGSATTAHAVMQLNAEDGGNRKFILVQLPEECGEKSEAYKAGYKTIAEISKERIRRAGKKIKEENPETAKDLDIGFRVLKVDTSNMKNTYYKPNEINQQQIAGLISNIKEDRTNEDLLFQVMLDSGVQLDLEITTEEIMGKKVYFVAANSLCACFETNLPERLFSELAKREPVTLVLKDSSFVNNDALKTNVVQIFRQLSPETELKVI